MSEDLVLLIVGFVQLVIGFLMGLLYCANREDRP